MNKAWLESSGGPTQPSPTQTTFSSSFTGFTFIWVKIYSNWSSTFNSQLVWTLCLMHRSMCIWQYILQNYNYKLHFQNLFIYNISDVSIRTLAAENLDVCTACDPWDSNIQLTMGIDRRLQIYPNGVQLVSK